MSLRLNRRRAALAITGLTTGLATGLSARAQGEGYPSQTITVINPYAAGGPADTMARALAQRLAARLKQTVVVDSKAGGAATIGTGFVARARPDGHTLLLGTSAGHVVTPLMQRVPYDGVGDFVFIGLVASQPSVLVVHPDLGVDSVAALIARARKEPGALNYASAGAGGATHLGAELFLQRAQIRITHVPYSGAAPALKDLLGGQVQMGMLNLGATRAHIEAGKLKALAYGGRQRSPLLPGVPTLAEAGWGGAEVPTWYSLAAPKGTPAPVVERLAATLAEIREDASWVQFLDSQGSEHPSLSPRDTTAFVQADKAAMARLLGSLNLLER